MANGNEGSQQQGMINNDERQNQTEIGNRNSVKDMQPIQWYKYVPAFLVAILLIWKPLFVVLFPGWIYTSDLSTVFLFQGCIGGSTQTVFVFCLLEVLIACVLLKKIVVPALFRVETWKTFDHLKRR